MQVILSVKNVTLNGMNEDKINSINLFIKNGEKIFKILYKNYNKRVKNISTPKLDFLLDVKNLIN